MPTVQVYASFRMLWQLSCFDLYAERSRCRARWSNGTLATVRLQKEAVILDSTCSWAVCNVDAFREACEGTMEVGPEEVREICTHLCSQLNQTRFAAYAGVPKCVCVRTAGGACRTMRIATCVTLAKSVFRSLLRTQHCPVIAQGRPVAQLPWRKHSSACLAPRASTKLSVVAFLLLRSLPEAIHTTGCPSPP